jgi:endonuclease-3
MYGHLASDPSPFHSDSNLSTGMLSEPINGLIETILSQNSMVSVTKRTMQALCRDYATWQAAFDAGAGAIEKSLQGAGGNLAKTKAGYIWSVLSTIHRERGELSLRFLRGMEPRDARIYLESLPGVGPKTAACVMLFNLQSVAQPVDTHIKRVSNRLGITKSTQDKRIEEVIVGSLLKTWEANFEFHLNCIAHGQNVCRAIRPKCDSCNLADICHSFREREAG